MSQLPWNKVEASCYVFAMSAGQMEIGTLGHSTHDVKSLGEILNRHEIRLLVDVRRFPGSRRHPQFNKDALHVSLSQQDISYLHLPGLGGHRKPRGDSANAGWNVEAFQGYADHMQTQEFDEALAQMMKEALSRRTAYMCAEGLWWKCHRRLLSDALVARGWVVRHIMPNGEMSEHRLTEFAVREGLSLSYPPPQPTLPLP